MSTYNAIHSLIAFQNKTQNEQHLKMKRQTSARLPGFRFRICRNDIMFPCGVAYVLYVTKSTIEIICLFSNGNNFIVTSMLLPMFQAQCFMYNNCFWLRPFAHTPQILTTNEKVINFVSMYRNECSMLNI